MISPQNPTVAKNILMTASTGHFRSRPQRHVQGNAMVAVKREFRFWHWKYRLNICTVYQNAKMRKNVPGKACPANVPIVFGDMHCGPNEVRRGIHNLQNNDEDCLLKENKEYC